MVGLPFDFFLLAALPMYRFGVETILLTVLLFTYYSKKW